MQTSATYDDKNEGNFGLNFDRLTPGLRNKPKQLPPYPKSSRENVLPRQSLHKASANIEESVDSEDTTFEPIRSTTKSSHSTKTSSGGSCSSKLYDRNPSVETPKEERSTMARNSCHVGPALPAPTMRSGAATTGKLIDRQIGIQGKPIGMQGKRESS
jgi:hypothetical protein